ncbi:MAG: AzlD domain-containing protein [Coriobacteriia bacterium]|nr:AzlD domain-containing protein [Coriobacteriia bacterium]
MRSMAIILHGHVPHPAWLERLLKHVPVAALTALVVPGALYVHQGAVYSLAPARTVAAVVALLVALRTKNTLATLGAGMGVLWVAQWAMGLLG